MSMAMRCPKCQTKVEPADRFCLSCGAALPRPEAARPVPVDRPASALTCPQCGSPLREKDAFCGSCGGPAGAEPAARRAAPAPEPRPSAPAPAPAPPPAKQARPQRGTIFAGYLNIAVWIGLIAYARQLFVTGASDLGNPYRPFELARYALIGLAAGMLIFGLRLWLVKNRVARRHGRIIFFVSLLGIAVGFLWFA
jgi:hypothetical protein